MPVKHKTKRFPIMFDPEFFARLETYRYERRIPTLATAVRQLLELGLAHEQTPHSSDNHLQSPSGSWTLLPLRCIDAAFNERDL